MTTGFGLSVRDGDWTKVRQNFQHIGSLLLGPTSTPVFDGATLTGNVTVGGNLAVGGNLTTTGYGDFGELRLHNNDYLGWYDNGTRRSFLMANSDSDDLWLWGYDNLGLCSYGPINFTPSGDITDYIRFQTVANVPEITTIGACNLQITASGGSIIVGDNLTIGLAEAGIDYTLTFNGESDNCVLTYDEDNNKLNFGDTAIFTSGTLGAGATTLTGSLSMASYDITCDDIVADGITCNRIKSVDDLNCHIDMTDQTDVIAIEPGYDDGDIGITFKSVDNTAASPQIYPNIFGNYGQLGLSSYRWNKLWVNDIDAVGSLTAGSLITAGNIGIAADTDLLQLASGALTVNGSQLIDGLADVVQLTVKGHSTLTANLQNWTDNADGILASVDAGGNIYTGGNFQCDGNVETTGNLDLPTTTSTVGQILINDSPVLHTYTHSLAPLKNTFIGGAGNFTLHKDTADQQGSANVGIGELTMNSLTHAYYNMGLGTGVLRDLTTGNSNVAIGTYAGLSLTTGCENVCIGRSAGASNIGNHRNVCIGNYAGAYNTLGDRLIIDNQSRGNAATEITNAILYGIMAAAPADQTLRINAVCNVTENIQIDGTQVIGNRVIDARCDDAVNSGDATTDGVIDALRDAMIAHGLVAAA